MSERTTIEVPKDIRDQLREERKPHESTYGETIARLLGNPNDPYPTEEEVQKIARQVANEQIGERVIPKAQQ